MTLPFEIEKRSDQIKREVEKCGAELIEISFRSSRLRGALVVVVDKPQGITLEDCAQINRHLSQYFDDLSDEDGFFSVPYYLEVNSPGLDRPLKTESDFRRVLGQRVKVAFKNERGIGLVCAGAVAAVANGILILQPVQGTEKISIPFESITKASREIRVGK